MYIVYSCFDIIFMVLTRITIRRDSVSLLGFPFLSQVQVFSCDIPLVCRLKCLYNCFSSHFYFVVIFVLFIIIIIIIFIRAYADGFRWWLTLEFVWQQVPLSLQDSSQYSGRSQ